MDESLKLSANKSEISTENVNSLNLSPGKLNNKINFKTSSKIILEL